MPESYLIVKLAAAGDVLLATAMARQLRRARPQCHIAWLVTAYAAPLLAANPDLDEVLPVPAPAAGGRARLRAAAAWRRVLAPWCRRHPAAVALLAHRSSGLALLLHAAGLRAVAGWDNGRNWGLAAVAPFSPAPGSFLQLGAPRSAGGLPLPETEAWPQPGQREGVLYQDWPCHHRLALHAGLARAALALAAGAAPALALAPPRLELRREELAAGEAAWNGAPRPRWIIAPGGAANPWSAMPNRLWPRERFLELGRRARASGIALRWLGGPGDAPLTAWLAARLRTPAADLAGRLGLRQSAALIAAADLLIGNDSLPLAMAQALARPALGLFGPTPGALIHLPGQPYLQGLAGCGPCYDPRAGLAGTAYVCPRARCMERITIAAVWRQALAASAVPPCSRQLEDALSASGRPLPGIEARPQPDLREGVPNQGWPCHHAAARAG